MQPLFDRYSSFCRTDTDGAEYRTSTKKILVKKDIWTDIAPTLRAHIADGKWALVADSNTWAAAGERVARALEGAGISVHVEMLTERASESALVCDDARIDEMCARLREGAYSHAIAVGAGTVNDIVKMATFRCGIAFSSFATAPSNNGTTSAIAAILSEGVKTTRRCHATTVAMADVDVMAAAPYRMIASGIGDLYSKPVSNADWRLSARLLGTRHSPIVMELVNAGAALLDGVAERLAARDPDAVARLTGALMMSGLAMQAAGNSGPASGGEHLISHYIDMTAVRDDDTYDFHGCQVAVGTITTSALYAHVAAMDPTQIDPDACADAWPAWSEYVPTLQARFGTLYEAVAPRAQAMYPTPDEVRLRLRALVAAWHDVFTDAGATLRPTAELEAELRAAQCPTRFAELNVGPARAREAIVWCKDIRARYTILHLAAELGVLERFAGAWVDAQAAR